MHYLPTRIIYGDKALNKGSVYLKNLGKKALLVTGKHSAIACGAQEDILSELKTLNIEWALFNSVPENPDLQIIMQGVKAFTDNHCDFIIGIGGGSPIDAAKAIALTAANGLDIDNIYNTAAFKSTYPVVAIPTTAGTGTEATQYSVLTDTEKHKKAGFGHDLAYPALSLVDPHYTLSLSKEITINTSIDALSHLLEGLYSNKRTPLIYPLIYQGIKLIYTNLTYVLSNLTDYTGREALMHASLYGGITISHTSTTLQHSIGYPLTSVYNIPHGLANGIVMKDILELYYPAVKHELDELFAYLSISKSEFYDWLDAFEMSSKVKLTPDFIETKIPEVLASRNMANNPFEIKAEDIRRIYHNII
jgi:alcohol dehydrogenase class IV